MGLTVGANLVLVATGLTLVFGMMGVINFAHSAAAVLAVGGWLVGERTSLGLSTRAAPQDPTMAAVLGVNTQRLNPVVFALGSGLAATAGVVLGAMTSLSPQMGAGIVLDA